MPKNIIICCDGTDNKLTINKNTNVIHLYSCLEKSNRQVTYYHPGVGTLAPDGISSAIGRAWLKFKDKLFATSLENNMKSAYFFLMNHYEKGDAIYLFGFSRGAYTVRMLSGMIQLFGLLHKGNEDNFKYALDIYYRDDKKLFQMANSFKSKFSREVPIHFMGVWDTVVAAGGFLNLYTSFPYSGKLEKVDIVRHAVAIDERRKHYDYFKVDPAHKNCKEVFFAGVHSDVGGSYPEEGLSKLALEWMLGEATAAGLLIHEKLTDKFLGQTGNYQRPCVNGEVHNSLTWYFRIADCLPRLRYSGNSLFNTKFDFRLWPSRKISEDAMVHESVFLKIVNDKKYDPKNLNTKTQPYVRVYNNSIKYCDTAYENQPE